MLVNEQAALEAARHREVAAQYDVQAGARSRRHFAVVLGLFWCAFPFYMALQPADALTWSQVIGGPAVFLAVALGGYMMAGAANAINMVVDRDIDARMKRTAKRPTVTQRVSSRDALLFAFALAVLGFAVLWWGANLLAATLALMGLIWYVLVYTLYLKRRTWHNIVIGGAAGAIPPVIGWAAVTHSVALEPLVLFLIIFIGDFVELLRRASDTPGAGAGVPALVRDLGADVSRQRLTLLGGDVVDIVGEAPGDAPAPHLAFDHDRGWLRRVAWRQGGELSVYELSGWLRAGGPSGVAFPRAARLTRGGRWLCTWESALPKPLAGRTP